MVSKKSAAGETGSSFELDRLFASQDPRRRSIESAQRAETPYRTFHDSMRQVLEGGPLGYSEGETWDPPTKWMSDVHYRLTQKLLLDDWSKVKIYPALGTAADRYHGVDLFLVFEDPKTGKKATVTVDFSIQDSKRGGYKADVIISDTGVMANDKYPHVGGIDIPEIEHASRGEEEVLEERRREAVATILVEVLREKLFLSGGGPRLPSPGGKGGFDKPSHQGHEGVPISA